MWPEKKNVRIFLIFSPCPFHIKRKVQGVLLGPPWLDPWSQPSMRRKTNTCGKGATPSFFIDDKSTILYLWDFDNISSNIITNTNTSSMILDTMPTTHITLIYYCLIDFLLGYLLVLLQGEGKGWLISIFWIILWWMDWKKTSSDGAYTMKLYTISQKEGARPRGKSFIILNGTQYKKRAAPR